MSGGHKRRAYLATCIGLAKTEPHWIRWVISDWDMKTEVARKTTGLRPIHIALLKLALRRAGTPL